VTLELRRGTTTSPHPRRRRRRRCHAPLFSPDTPSVALSPASARHPGSPASWARPRQT